MLFSFSRLIAAVAALAALNGAVARPFPTPETDALVERDEYDALSKRADFADPTLFSRQLSPDFALEPRARGPSNKAAETKQRSKEGNKPIHGNLPVVSKPPQPPRQKQGKARLTLGPDARKELDAMKLHGKDRKKAIKWHKGEIKKEMKQNPLLKGKANAAMINHVAHEGGSDPKEKLHMTVSFQDKNNQGIANSYNGEPNHHVYVDKAGLSRIVKGAMAKNNAMIKGASMSSVGPQGTPGKSKGKGKGKHRGEKNTKHEDFSVS